MTSTDFEKYMRSQGLSAASCKKYAQDTPNNLSVQSVFVRLTGTQNMYAVTSKSKLKDVIESIRRQDFDIVGQRMYSCGVKKYLKCLEDTGMVTP